MSSEVSFSDFLEALRDMQREEESVRPTAHTASVSTADWERVQIALAKLDGNKQEAEA